MYEGGLAREILEYEHVAAPRRFQLVDLFFRPGRFFRSDFSARPAPYLFLIAWCYGMAAAIDRLDTEFLRADLGRPRPGWEIVGSLVGGSWLVFWGWALLGGLVSAITLWWIGGWWYRVRLRWSGATAVSPALARRVFIFSGLVWAGPTVLAAAMQTFIFANYQEAWSSEEIYSLVLMVFPFWSLVTSYFGATTAFDARRGRAALWFVVLPTLLYFLVFGVVGALALLAGPTTTAIPGDEVPADHLRMLQQEGYLSADEDVIWFYSGGLFSIKEDGNFYTDQRIVSYAEEEDGLFYSDARWEEVVDIDVEFAESLLDYTWIWVGKNDGDTFALIVAPEDGRDRVFVERLMQMWQQRRGW